MSASSQADGVRSLATPLAEAAGLVVEDVNVTPAGRRRVLRVTVDLPAERTGGVPMESVAEVSQAISAALDSSDVMGGTPYVLEVSSPGVDRPLTERRHWSRARGRLVTALLVAGGEAKGRLTDVGDDGVTLEGHGTLAWADVRRGRVEIEFTKLDEAELDDADVGDDLEGIDDAGNEHEDDDDDEDDDDEGARA